MPEPKDLVDTVAIRDQHVIQQLDDERVRRGHASMTKTAEQMLTERLTQLATERNNRRGEACPDAA